MKIFYDSNGQILAAVPDRDLFYFEHTIQVPFTELVIDETEENKALCRDLRKVVGKTDHEKEGKYKVVNSVVKEKVGWKEHVQNNVVWPEE